MGSGRCIVYCVLCERKHGLLLLLDGKGTALLCCSSFVECVTYGVRTLLSRILFAFFAAEHFLFVGNYRQVSFTLLMISCRDSNPT